MKLKKTHGSIGLLVLILSLTIVGTINQNQRLISQYTLETPRASAGEITVFTPENKTYKEPDSGYYPAIYGFDNDIDGGNPEYFGIDETGGEVNIVDEIGGHKKVLGLSDDSSVDWPEAYNIFETPRTFGTYEYWVRTTDASNFQGLRLYSGAIIDTNVMVDFVIRNEKFQYYSDSAWHDITICADNQWYHIEIAFECTTGGYRGLNQYKFKVWINETEFGEYSYWYNKVSATAIQFMGGSNLAKNLYIDAIGYSWNPYYNIGDNQNEGLLLSYDNTTNLDWQGYSLDGQANKRILGNTTIPLPSDGIHNIQVFGNDSMGIMYESSVRHFSVDITAPEISIDYPSASQEFSEPPAYILSINETNIDALWYTLNGGTENPFTGSTGTISETAWSALPNGPVTIRFVVRDIAAREAYDEVIVVKISSGGTTPPPAIPGYNPYLLLGFIGVISGFLLRKRHKS